MRKWIKSYLVFTSFLYRMAVFFLIPLALMGIAFYKRSWGDTIVVAVTAVFIIVEVLADNWLFGGLHTARGAKMEYLRTSGRGMTILKRALIMDMVRRFLTALLVFLCCSLAASPLEAVGALRFIGWFGYLLFPVLTSSFLAALGICCARFADMLWINMLIGYVAAVLGILCWTLPGLVEYIWVYNMIFAVLGAICGSRVVKIAMKKVEGGYYEK